jgi:molecular chaperone DnaK
MKDSMPLCVVINPRKNIIVGDAAYAANIKDKLRRTKFKDNIDSNSYCGFTRTLGTDIKYYSSLLNKDFTSEELLAECFKKLKSFVSDEILNSVVITVPDKFINPQNEAIIRAGKMAGFEQIELVQESFAASLGYGLGSKNKDSFWLVFDFGDGTFDVALIKAEEGILTVKDSEGDNWLGGSNIKHAIIDEIIIPNIAENFAVQSILEDSDKKEILRNAVMFYAEEAKKQLSFEESHCIFSYFGDLPFEDENGNELAINIEITQQDLAWVSRPIYQKAIDITIDLLKRNNLKGKDIDTICLVGGDTYSPVLRKMLKEQITDKIDVSIDPMTVVAKGAALYASINDLGMAQIASTSTIALDLKYESATIEEHTLINFKINSALTTFSIPEKVYATLKRGDKAYLSNKILIRDKKATLIEVLLNQNESNYFSIILTNEKGDRIPCQPNQFKIIQSDMADDFPITLPYHIGISKYCETEDKELFQTIKGLEKHKKIPATGVINGFKTRFDLRPGVISDVIRFPIYQGDYNAEGTNPLLNNLITEIIISGESLPALLPEGSYFNITIKVDRSQQMQFSAYFPLLNHTEELEIEIKQTEPPTVEFLFKEISKAKQTAKKLNATNVSEKLEVLEVQLENDKVSADVKLKIFDELRKELLKLDSAIKTAEWPRIEQELKDAFYEMEISSSNEAQISESRFTIEQILKEKNIREAKLMLVEINDFNGSTTISDKYIDDLKGKLVLFYADNPSMGKERFRFLLMELIRIEKNKVAEDDKMKVTDLLKIELLKWK